MAAPYFLVSSLVLQRLNASPHLWWWVEDVLAYPEAADPAGHEEVEVSEEVVSDLLVVQMQMAVVR